MHIRITVIALLLSLFSHGQVKRQLAEQAMEEGNFEEALKNYEDLYKKNPNQNFFESIVICYIQLEELDEGTAFINQHINRTTGGMSIYVIDRGYLHLMEGDTTTANNDFNQMLALIKKQPGLAYGASERFKKYGVYQFALKSLLEAERANPNMAFDHQKALIYAELGMLVEMYTSYLDALERSPAFLNNLQNVIRYNMNRDGEIPQSNQLKAEIITRIQEDKGIVFNQLLIWVLTQEQEYAQAFRQLKALYLRGQENAFKLYQLAENAVQSKDYRNAKRIFEFLIEQKDETPFYADATVGYILATQSELDENNGSTDEYSELKGDINAALINLKGHTLSSTLYLTKAEVEFYNLHQSDSAFNTTLRAIEFATDHTQPEALAKLLKGDIELAQGLPYDAILTYSQVEGDFDADLLGQEARFRKARVAFFTGDFAWAQTMFDVLKRSTSKLISNDALRYSLLIKDNAALDTTYLLLEKYAKALLYKAQLRYHDALYSLDTLDTYLSLSGEHPLNDEVLYTRAELLEALGQNDSAASLFTEVAEKYKRDLLADEALFRAANLYQYKLYDLERAKTLYEKLLLEHGNSVFAERARSEYRKLRGDQNT